MTHGCDEITLGAVGCLRRFHGVLKLFFLLCQFRDVNGGFQDIFQFMPAVEYRLSRQDESPSVDFRFFAVRVFVGKSLLHGAPLRRIPVVADRIVAFFADDFRKRDFTDLAETRIGGNDVAVLIEYCDGDRNIVYDLALKRNAVCDCIHLLVTFPREQEEFRAAVNRVDVAVGECAPGMDEFHADISPQVIFQPDSACQHRLYFVLFQNFRLTGKFLRRMIGIFDDQILFPEQFACPSGNGAQVDTAEFFQFRLRRESIRKYCRSGLSPDPYT